MQRVTSQKETGKELIAQNLQAMQKFVQTLQLKSYSVSTIKTYRNEFMQLLQLLKSKNVDELTVERTKKIHGICNGETGN